MKVLIIEDQRIFAETLILKLKEHNCHWVMDLDGARQSMETFQPDVVVSDVNLGRETSEDYVAYLHEQGIKVCFFTSYPAFRCGDIKVFDKMDHDQIKDFVEGR